MESPLNWQRDSNGYRVQPIRPVASASNTILGNLTGFRIVPGGGRAIVYRPRLDRLFVQFANVSTMTELLKFVNRYGLLTRTWDERHRGENVELALDSAQNMKRLVDSLTGGSIPKLSEPGVVARLEVVLSTNGLQFRAPNLLSALWLHAGTAAAGGSQLRQCAYPACRKVFEVGPNSRPRRRGDAKYCCHQHQERHKSLKRSLP